MSMTGLAQALRISLKWLKLQEELEDEDEAMAVVESFDELRGGCRDFRLKPYWTESTTTTAILSIHAGTGGVDAMDWARDAWRMYTRWADNHGYAVKIVDLQDDAEAGIKKLYDDNRRGKMHTDMSQKREWRIDLLEFHRLMQQERGRHHSHQLRLCRRWTKILITK